MHVHFSLRSELNQKLRKNQKLNLIKRHRIALCCRFLAMGRERVHDLLMVPLFAIA